MPLVVPNAFEVEVLIERLTPPLTIRLFGNNATPTGLSSAASFTEISGAGYTNRPLTFANWTITGGDPSLAIYNVAEEWNFTGAVDAPGTIYGYFVTRNSDGRLMWAERLPITPFTPIAGSIIRVLPRFTAQSLF